MSTSSRGRSAHLESLTLCRDAADFRGAAVSLIALGRGLAAEGHDADALTLFAAAAQLARSDELDPWPPRDELNFDAHVARARVGTDDPDAVWTNGLTMPLDDVVAVVRTRSGVAVATPDDESR